MADKDFVVKNGLVTGSNTVTVGTAAVVASNGNVYQVTTAGTSGTTSPNFVLGTGTDGTATLTYVTSFLPPIVVGTKWTASTPVTLNQQIFYIWQYILVIFIII